MKSYFSNITREDDYLAAARLSVMTQLRYGDEKEAVRRAEQYLDVIGSDMILERVIARARRGE